MIDIIRTSGSMDVFLYPLHLFALQEDSHALVINILELINTVVAHYGEDIDIQSFLRLDGNYKGLEVLAYLMGIYFKKKG
jgi:hypothetical protein